MIEDYAPYDKILKNISEEGYIVATMDSEYAFKCLRRLEAEGLIYKEQISVFYLTSEGHRALRLGGFENWLDEVDKQKKIQMNIKGTEKLRSKKIFISHSSKDIDLVEKVIDILETVGVPSNKIFCTSLEGYGVKLGDNFLETIKEELNADDLVLFILSDNFYSSAVCLCEMGAAWVRTNEHIPILIPPFDYHNVKGVIPTIHGMKINEKEKFNSLKDKIEVFFDLNPINLSSWERKRNKILESVKTILDNKVNELDIESNIDNEPEQRKDLKDVPLNILLKIKELSKQEWPNKFNMQLDYIRQQTEAYKDLLSHIPIDISKSDFKTIRLNAQKEWPNSFVMQLDYERQEVESLRELNKM